MRGLTEEQIPKKLWAKGFGPAARAAQAQAQAQNGLAAVAAAPVVGSEDWKRDTARQEWRATRLVELLADTIEATRRQVRLDARRQVFCISSKLLDLLAFFIYWHLF